MELDKRIIKGKRPLTCFDTEQAKEFLGKECYFSNCKSHYKNLSAFEKFVSLTDYCIGELTAIMDLGDRVFDVDQQCTEFRYCLPCEWVKEEKKEQKEQKEQKYRPFSLNEFTGLYAISDVVTYRIKDCEVIEQSMFIGCQSSNDGDTPGNGYVVIGNCKYSLKELFNHYELQYLNHWQPFGILEE